MREFRRYPPEKLAKYPHMSPEDVRIWERYLEHHAQEWEWFAYGVKVGKGAPVPPGTPEWLARMWKSLTKKRIDVVGSRNGRIWVIEVKPRCGLSAFGQAMAYRELYAQEYGVRPLAMVVCEYSDPDAKALCLEHEIQVTEVGGE